MASKRLKIPEAELKILFAKSGNICAFPKCETPVIADEKGEMKPLAEMAHVIAYADRGPRSDPSLSSSERNKASNLILLCPTHHTIIDKFEHQYNTLVLREMKRLHEESQTSNKVVKDEKVEWQKETLYSSLLPISHLPRVVFSAETRFRKSNILGLFDILNSQANNNALYSFELRDKKMYTFVDLNKPDNPFRGAYNQSSVKIYQAIEMWDNPDSHRLYITLLNRGLTSFLRKLRVGFDAEHYRHFFQPDKDRLERKFTYKSLAGKTTTRSVVINPKIRATGDAKPFWIHLAANLAFQYIGNYQWVLTIRPERHLTKDGYEFYTHASIGKKITRIKSTMYNWNYLQELHLWREFITGAKPRRILKFSTQAIVIENKLLDCALEWPGVPDDKKSFITKMHDDDLFSMADLQNLGDDEDCFDEDLFLEEYQ